MITTVLSFFVILSVLVLVHELGHFLSARKSGIWVEEFGFGLPPRLFGKKIGETLYSINLLPFGGFVRLHGENSEEEIKKPQKAFLNKSIAKRSLVITAGVIMNMIFAIFAFSLVYTISGIPRDTGKVSVIDISPDSPAQISGIFPGDIIKSIDKIKVESTASFANLVEERKGKRVNLEIIRGEETKTISLVVRKDHPEDEGPLGVIITSTEIYFPPIIKRPFYGAYYGLKEAFFWGSAVLGGLLSIVKDLFAGSAPKDISGPVGIFALTSEVGKSGTLALINFAGILSVNLAILNILPLPALDGGRMLFIVLEAILGKKVLPKAEAAIHAVGMIFLLALLFTITIYDVKRLLATGSLTGFLDSFIK